MDSGQYQFLVLVKRSSSLIAHIVFRLALVILFGITLTATIVGFWLGFDRTVVRQSLIILLSCYLVVRQSQIDLDNVRKSIGNLFKIPLRNVDITSIYNPSCDDLGLSSLKFVVGFGFPRPGDPSRSLLHPTRSERKGLFLLSPCKCLQI